MTIVTEDQALSRWDTLPDTLREALCSEANTEFLWKTCSDENVPGDRIDEAARVAGYVLMGFIHPEDVSQELVETIGIDVRTGKSIQDALATRVFAPLRPELEKTYSPLSKSEIRNAATGPKIMQDVGPSINGVISASNTSFRPTSAPNLQARPQIAPASIPTAAAPINKSRTFSDVGWSKSTGPVVKLDTSLVPPTAPAGAQQPKPAQPAASGAQSAIGQQHSSMGEFERLSAMKKAPPTPGAPTPTPAGAPAEPAPFMLHHDNTFTAAQSNAAFTLQRSDTGAQMDMQAAKTSPAIPRPAVLELGKAAAGPGAPKGPTSTPGVTHYTDYKPPLASVPTASAGPRNVSEITAPAPVAKPVAPSSSAPAPIASPAPAPKPVPDHMSIPVPKPPTPPAPPSQSPQQPPQQPQGKVIVKNFP